MLWGLGALVEMEIRHCCVVLPYQEGKGRFVSPFFEKTERKKYISKQSF